MERRFKFASLMAGSALAALAAQPAHAAATVIQGVELNPTKAGLAVELSTKSGDIPQIFAASKGNTLEAEIANVRLDLPQGERFQQDNPAPGIDSILLEAAGDNTVRLTINGAEGAPVSTVEKKTGNELLISLNTSDAAVDHELTVLPDNIETVPGPDAVETPIEIAQDAPENVPDVLVPEPEVIIDGNPVPGPALTNAPPFLPRAVAPPVGDMAVSEIEAGLDVIDLGTAERVPRLVLRDAPAREVLSLLARAAGLNLAFTDASAEEAGAEVRVTLDIENEPVQNVFNYVLQISGLEANRIGRTIFVGPRLPQSARNVIVRSIRINQVDVASAVNFLVFMGAESAFLDEQEVTTVTATAEIGTEVEEVETTELQTNVAILRAEYQDASPLLAGLQVIGDPRTSSLTLIGTPRQVEIATAQLVQLDLRRRQVAVNLRVVDVDLSAIQDIGTSFSFGTGDTGVSQNGGAFGLAFNPANPLGVTDQFVFQLNATVTNGQSRIITDPTLIIQEGQDAAVLLVEEVVNENTQTTTVDEGTVIVTQDVELVEVGLNLQINIDRIDDNGFVSLSVAPSISAPTSQVSLGGDSFVVPIATRALSSGQVRVRDGQTLVLSGIIEEQDRITVSKVPILGDLPIIGALFRNTNSINERRELIVLLTPEILDDSDQNVFGYSYAPGEDVQELLEERGLR
ncbi:MAG: AMIN domain-containing protein [Cyanobacteria bacterium P01_A01_bin.105]